MSVASPRQIQEWRDGGRETFARDVIAAAEPVVMRGLVRDWPATRAAVTAEGAARYLLKFYNGAPVTRMRGSPDIGGRLFFTDDFNRLNFSTEDVDFASALSALIGCAPDAAPPTLYIGCASAARFLPGFAEANKMPLAPDDIVPNLWISNRAIVGPHNDLHDNIACVVAGRRRFRLFPPEQLANLYVGPLEFSPAGRPVSLVSVGSPDFDTHPRYRDALMASQEAVLEPGDALYIPTFWWHSVESLTPFNLLVNYWWNASGGGAAKGEACMIHGLLTIADLPEPARRAWRAYFDQYVFKLHGEPAAHIPTHARGWLGARSPDLVDKMKNIIRRALNE